VYKSSACFGLHLASVSYPAPIAGGREALHAILKSLSRRAARLLLGIFAGCESWALREVEFGLRGNTEASRVADYQCVLYGVHVAQVYSFFDSLSRHASTYHRYLVCWVLALSTAHMLVVWSASYRYFVVGTIDLSIWGEFWWVLSVQDGLVSYKAGLYGRGRAESRYPSWLPLLSIISAVGRGYYRGGNGGSWYLRGSCLPSRLVLVLRKSLPKLSLIAVSLLLLEHGLSTPG
jgi:hypothetical protein